MKTYQQDWEEFWADICLGEDGTLDLEQVKKELSDFRGMMEEVGLVYDSLTRGRISKPNTCASVVISEVEAIHQEELDELEEKLTNHFNDK